MAGGAPTGPASGWAPAARAGAAGVRAPVREASRPRPVGRERAAGGAGMEPARRGVAGAAGTKDTFLSTLYMRFPGAGPSQRNGPARPGRRDVKRAARGRRDAAGGGRRRDGAGEAVEQRKPPRLPLLAAEGSTILRGPPGPRRDSFPPRFRVTTRHAPYAGRRRTSLINTQKFQLKKCELFY